MDKEVYKFYKCRVFFWSFTFCRTLSIYGFLFENYQIDLKEHIEVIVIVLVIITLPVLLKFAKNVKKRRLIKLV
jgi:membrane-associated protein